MKTFKLVLPVLLLCTVLFMGISFVPAAKADEYNDGYNAGEVVAEPTEIDDAEYMEGYTDGEEGEDRDEQGYYEGEDEGEEMDEMADEALSGDLPGDDSEGTM